MPRYGAEFDAGGAFAHRVDQARKSDAYKKARTEVVEAVREYSGADAPTLRAAGGWSAIIKKAIDNATAEMPEDDLGLFGRGCLVRMALHEEVPRLRLEAQGVRL